jgi:hypothetical protein
MMVATDDGAGGVDSGAAQDVDLGGEDLDVQMQRTVAARRRLNAAKRELIAERSRGAARHVKAKNLRVGASVRASARPALEKVLEGAEAASEDEMTSLSVTFNIRIRQLYEEPSWIKLFRSINEDKSGLISFSELMALTRDEALLHLLPAEVSDAQVKAFWIAMDTDRSGFISCGEFGAFMRKGEHVLNPSTTWRERQNERNQRLAAQRREQRQALASATSTAASAPAASDELVDTLAALCSAVLAERAAQGAPISPFELFKRADAAGAGALTVDGWLRLVRGLGVGDEQMCTSDVMSVWRSLLAASAGHVGMSEWAAFMRRMQPSGTDAASAFKFRAAMARREMAAAVRAQDEQLAEVRASDRRREEAERKASAQQAREARRATIGQKRAAIVEKHRAAHDAVRAFVDQTKLKNALKVGLHPEERRPSRRRHAASQARAPSTRMGAVAGQHARALPHDTLPRGPPPHAR